MRIPTLAATVVAGLLITRCWKSSSWAQTYTRTGRYVGTTHYSEQHHRPANHHIDQERQGRDTCSSIETTVSNIGMTTASA